jgi:hypothetical protein
MENLDSVKMGEHEHLSTYLKRFNQAIKAYDGSSVAAPGLPLQVALFLRNLHDSRFKDFKIHVRSEYHQAAISYPSEINEAFIRASNWELDHPTPIVQDMIVHRPPHQLLIILKSNQTLQVEVVDRVIN